MLCFNTKSMHVMMAWLVKTQPLSWDKAQISEKAYFQSLDMKYCSSNSRCSQSSTIFSVYRCSIRHDRILHTHTHTFTPMLMRLKNKMINILCVCVCPCLCVRACACVCLCVCETSSHWISIVDVFAGSLDDRLAGLVERPVDPVVGSRVGRLDQWLQLQV